MCVSDYYKLTENKSWNSINYLIHRKFKKKAGYYNLPFFSIDLKKLAFVKRYSGSANCNTRNDHKNSDEDNNLGNTKAYIRKIEIVF